MSDGGRNDRQYGCGEAIGIREGKNGELRKLSKWLPWFVMTEIRIVVIRT